MKHALLLGEIDRFVAFHQQHPDPVIPDPEPPLRVGEDAADVEVLAFMVKTQLLVVVNRKILPVETEGRAVGGDPTGAVGGRAGGGHQVVGGGVVGREIDRKSQVGEVIVVVAEDARLASAVEPQIAGAKRPAAGQRPQRTRRAPAVVVQARVVVAGHAAVGTQPDRAVGGFVNAAHLIARQALGGGEVGVGFAVKTGRPLVVAAEPVIALGIVQHGANAGGHLELKGRIGRRGGLRYRNGCGGGWWGGRAGDCCRGQQEPD